MTFNKHRETFPIQSFPFLGGGESVFASSARAHAQSRPTPAIPHSRGKYLDKSLDRLMTLPSLPPPFSPPPHATVPPPSLPPSGLPLSPFHLSNIFTLRTGKERRRFTKEIKCAPYSCCTCTPITTTADKGGKALVALPLDWQSNLSLASPE